jgi:hypothetical protein
MIRTEILSGLSAGDVVVVGPYKVLDTLAHDRPVEVGDPDVSGEPSAAGEKNGARKGGAHGRH